MALNVIKETKLTAALCRLSPPASPSKRTTKASRGSSKILAAFDAAMATDDRPPLAESGVQIESTSTCSKSSLHPFFLNANHSHPTPLMQKPKVAKTKTSSSSSATSALPGSVSGSSRQGKSTGRAHSRSKTTAMNAAPALPLYSYKDYNPTPAVVYVRHEEEADDLVQALSGPLGFDMEWVISWRNKSCAERRTAVVQLCDKRMILIVQLSEMKRFPQKVKEIIESQDIVKMGANIKNDGEKLYRDYGILAANLVELGAFAHRADATFAHTHRRSIVALAKVVEHYTSKTLDKGAVRCSNWEAAPLSEEHITYAANDAHCALVVYNRLLDIAAEQGRALGPAPYGNQIVPGMRSTNGTSSSISLASSTSSSHRTVSYVNDVDELLDRPRQSPQHLRAYNLWHHREAPLAEICATLRSRENPLKESTVISYVVRALQVDPSLPFSMDRLKALVQLEAGSWARHRDWIVQAESRKS